MKISGSEQLFERAKKVSPGGVHSPVRAFKGVGGTPRFIEKADGAYLYDVDGNRYLDFCMSWGPLMFGHRDPEVAEAVQQALANGWSYGTTEPYSLELAEFITSRIPWVEKIRFVNSGTEAVMAALRVARAATGRSKVLKFEGCYHGHFDALLVKSGSGLADMASPDSAGVTRATAAETLVAPLDNIPALEAILDQHGKDVACIVIEPMPANYGLLLQRPEFLRQVAALAKKYGALLMFDEVISGFRVAFGGMAEATGIRPDLVSYGKVIGGGFPVGAYGASRALMDWVAPAGPVYQAGTLSANPVAMRAGLAMVKKLDREMPYALLEKRAQVIASGMKLAAERQGVEFSVQTFSSVFWPIFGTPKTPDKVVRTVPTIPETHKARFAEGFHRMLDSGIYLAPSGFEVGFVSTVHDDALIQTLLQVFERSLK